VDGLRKAKDTAEEKSKAKTLFLANTCHELVRSRLLPAKHLFVLYRHANKAAATA
jgi:hypothetical protein